MDTKKTIQQEIDNLVVAIAELYNPLMEENTSDDEFTVVAEAIGIERDQVIDNLLVLAEYIIEVTVANTVESLKAAEEKKSARLRKLVPGDIAIKTPPAEAPVPLHTASAGAVMERVAELPRDVKAGAISLELPQDFTEAAQEALQGGGSSLLSASDFDGLPEREGEYTHNLGLTLAQESRREAGLPIKPYRPHVVMGIPERRPAPSPTPVIEEEEVNAEEG